MHFYKQFLCAPTKAYMISASLDELMEAPFRMTFVVTFIVVFGCGSMTASCAIVVGRWSIYCWVGLGKPRIIRTFANAFCFVGVSVLPLGLDGSQTHDI
ncbi:hypothetical protein BKA66DRAFT_479052 [Pyrenochaeta sp. MPI-SDFR-AT-0127]|nr:hypothetical protein BKA66DRAFT_479052 [Pyrenochaeta sp. MPI-SDFR-AT-0127]